MGHVARFGVYVETIGTFGVAIALGIAAVAEITASILSGSASVLADGLHNAGDVLTSFILLFTFALVRMPATRRFSSGYGRFEDVATLLIVLVIIITAAIAAAPPPCRAAR